MNAEHQLSDNDLLALYADGAPQAAQVLTERHLPRVFRHARRVVGDSAEAEDVAQDVMIRMWRAAPAWRAGEAKLSTWLYRVTANACVDRLRKRRAVSLEDAGDPIDGQPSAMDHLQNNSRLDALQTALNCLPERQRQAVILRHIEGLSNTEIAQIMDIGPRAVESLTARGKTALTALLADQRVALGYEDEE